MRGTQRFCLWIDDAMLDQAREHEVIRDRLEAVSRFRSESPLDSTKQFQDLPHRFVYLAGESNVQTIAVGAVSSERREYLPADLFGREVVVSNAAFAIYDGELWNLGVLVSKLHLAWVAAVCGKLKTDYRYSNTLGWNTFPVPKLTEKNRADLTEAAEGILLAREAHFPATIADLYDPEKMPANLRAAHDRNDEVLERIYIGRRFRNDTERLEKLFEMYTKMTKKVPA